MYRKSDRRWLVLGWGLILVVTSSLTVYPRFGFFHLQAALPALAWISSFALTYALQSSNSITATYSTSFLKRVITIGLLFLSLITAGPAYDPVFRARQSQYVHEYTDLVPLANEIRQYIGPANSIYIFPDDEALSNLYYLTGCTPPKFWVYSYPWYMLDWIKARMTVR